VAKIMGGKSAIPEQLGRGRSQRARSIDYPELRCVNHLEHFIPFVENGIIQGSEQLAGPNVGSSWYRSESEGLPNRSKIPIRLAALVLMLQRT
jgi:hypothetical protein